MNKVLLSFLLCAFTTAVFAQKETFDLITYTVPKNWKKETTENSINYTTINKQTGKWCRINIVKSTSSKGSIDKDFESEWQELVVKSYNPTEVPQLNEVQENGSWRIKAGGSKFIFNNSDAMVILTTATGYNRCMSIVTTANNQDHLKDIDAVLASVDFKKMEPAAEERSAVVNNANNAAPLGSWGVGTTVASAYNMHINEGSIVTQYTFNTNGTYSFYVKTFRYQLDKLLLTKETGTYKISGNNLSINPQKSAVEAWSKKNGTDNWGKLLSTDKKILEKMTYQFNVLDFGSGKTLVLKATAVTKRDGPFNNNDKDAWYYPAKSSVELIKLPGE